MLGFSYCGIHCSTYGCTYVPAALDQGRGMSAYVVEELEVDGRDGGYYVGNRVKPREFSLDCLVEDITDDTRQRLLRWLGRNTSGELVFDHKPYVTYTVHPVKPIEIKQYTHRIGDRHTFSGTFTIAFRCYDPFGKMVRNAYTGMPLQSELDATGILPAAIMPPPPSLEDRQFLLYNPGTERGHTCIKLAGDVGDGLIIENITTGQQCKIAGLRTGDIPIGAYLEINSGTGQVLLVKGEEKELAFHFHDLGYVMLAPCTPFVRVMRIAHTNGSKEITTDGMFHPHMAGQYVHVGGAWMKIRRVENAHTAHLVLNMAETGITDTPVVTMNEIRLWGDGIRLERCRIEYTPRV